MPATVTEIDQGCSGWQFHQGPVDIETMPTMDNDTRADLPCAYDLLNVVAPLVVVRERIGIDLNLPAWSVRAQVDKRAVVLDVPGWIMAIVGHETGERLLPIRIIVEKISVETHAIGKQGGHGNAGQIREGGQVAGGKSHERWISQF